VIAIASAVIAVESGVVGIDSSVIASVHEVVSMSLDAQPAVYRRARTLTRTHCSCCQAPISRGTRAGMEASSS
jgi:hypothetical protein